MTPAHIDRVFGRGRLRMVTGDHVEVFREEALPGERRRYTKRFLATAAGDFRHWTEREWRILARLVGHGIRPVPDVVQFDRGAADRPALVQTYDAGVTVDHWATHLPVGRDGCVLRHVFEDCAHWWALAHHCLLALDAIHELQLVHLDLKADNVCIPLGPDDFDPHAPGQLLTPRFDQIALIDFAFSLVSGESLNSALPIGRQADYDYQSPRLLQALAAGSRGDLLPTRQLDWRCDFFSLAAMLRRYLPDPEGPLGSGWTHERHAQARALVRRLLEVHDADLPTRRPHAALTALTSQVLDDSELGASLLRGWPLAIHGDALCDDSPTPVTRIALPVGADTLRNAIGGAGLAHVRRPHHRARNLLWFAALATAAAIGVPLLGPAWLALQQRQPLEHDSGLPTPMPEMRDQVLARAPAGMASTPPIGAESTGAAPAPTARAAPGRARVPAAATVPASGSAAPAPAPAPSPITPQATAAKVERDAARRAQVPANPAAAVAIASAPRSSARVIAQSMNHTPVRATVPMSELERAMAWLSIRGPSPRSAQPSGAPSLPTRASAPAPAPAPAPAQAPALSQATEPARSTVTSLPGAQSTDFVARARDLMTNQVPRAAQRAEWLVQRVLSVADQPDNPSRDGEIRSAARAIRLAPADPLTEIWIDANGARLFSKGAAVAFSSPGRAQMALVLQTGAFGANPLDPDIASNLAFYHLRQQPVQADKARQLALYALITRDRKFPTGRIEDWTTLAIANALSGRERDARDALFVTVALAPSLERQCKAAINAYEQYGERLRSPVEAMLHRVHSSGRSERSAFCELPAHWMATGMVR